MGNQPKLNYPHSSDINNDAETVASKMNEAKEAVETHREQYPEDKRKFLFMTQVIEDNTNPSIINFGYIMIDGDFDNPMMLVLLDTAKLTSGGYEPIIF
mgnify:CR=1 FL=1